MKSIVITLPHFFDGEAECINRIIRSGVDLVHIRKPGCDDRLKFLNLLNAINPDYIAGHIVLQDEVFLAEEFEVYGVHLTRRSPICPAYHRGNISLSCHSLEEVQKYKSKKRVGYMFLSPIFDSISKEGYLSAFTPDILRQASSEGIIDGRVVALGGITLQRLPQIREYGFGGAALLGDVWKRKDDADFDDYLHRLVSACRANDSTTCV